MKKIFLTCSEKDIIDPAEVEHRVRGISLRFYSELASTQDTAKYVADKTTDKGIVIAAETQTRGRGRFHREWVSPEGGLWFSIIVYPQTKPEKSIQLSIVAAISVCRSLERIFKIKPLIKWPNDVIVKGKKVAGILTEMSYSADKLRWGVIGVGMNVNNPLPRSLRKEASNLKSVLKKRVNRTILLSEILKDLKTIYARFHGHGFGNFEKEFERRSVLNKKKVKIAESGRIYKGRVKKLEADGSLLLEIAKDIRKKITGGTVLEYD